MAERWLRLVRKIGRLEPRGDLWDRTQGRTPADSANQAPVGGRLVAALVALVLLGPVAFAGWVFLRIDERPEKITTGETEGAIEVVCEQGGARLGAGSVELQPDGVSFVVRNPGRQDVMYARDPVDPERSWGLGLQGEEPVRRTLPIPPGEVLVGCFTTEFNVHEVPVEEYERLDVLDPHNRWPALKDQLECGEGAGPPVQAPADSSLNGELGGELLVETYSDDNHHDIYRMSVDGSEVALLAGPTDDYGPAWSPDGSRIVFVRDGEIYTMEADGSGVTRLTENDATDDLPAWSPDGTRIAFRSNRDGALSLYAMTSDGSDVSRLTSGGAGFDDSPSWSPDGTRIAFVSIRNEDPSCEDGEIYVVNADGSGLRRLTDNEAYEQQPAWSPDGHKIAFQRSNRSDYAWDIYVMNADGQDVRRLTDHPGFEAGPVWSPDGLMISFSSDLEAASGDLEDNRTNDAPVAGVAVYVINADGSAVTRISPSNLGNAFVSDWRA